MQRRTITRRHLVVATTLAKPASAAMPDPEAAYRADCMRSVLDGGRKLARSLAPFGASARADLLAKANDIVRLLETAG